MERLLGKTDVQRPQVVEYCVVCGDKASGKQAVITLGAPRGPASQTRSGWGGGQNVTVLFFIGMLMSISRSGCQIIGIKRKSQETVCDL